MNNLKLENQNGVLVITINRPSKMNALNAETVGEIRQAIEQLYTDKSVHSAIITGEGEKAFVAGADIAEFTKLNAEQATALAAQGQAVFASIENSPKPVIAAVNGFALGGGCELAMSCHIRLATPNAKFGQPEVNLGLIPGYGGTQRLTQLVGKGRAFELTLTADMIGAEEAYRLGLVNHVVADQTALLAKAHEILAKIATKAPMAVGYAIKGINAVFAEGDGYATEAKLFGDCFATQDFVEGTSAFVEKRKAVFKGC